MATRQQRQFDPSRASIQAAHRVAIIGTGAYAQALGARFAAVGIEVVYGSRSAEREAGEKGGALQQQQPCPMMLQGCPVRGPCAAVSGADVVVLAIPLGAHSAMAACIQRVIAGRGVVLIDVSNSPLDSASPASWLPSCLKRPKSVASPSTTTATKAKAQHVMPEGYAALPSHSSETASRLEGHQHLQCDGCLNGCHASSSSSASPIDIEDLVTADSPHHYTRSPARPRRDIETGNDEDDEDDETEEEDEEDYAELSNAERLQRLMPDVDVVKAFNTVSAYTLKSGIGARLDDRVLVCGDRPAAKELVSRLVHAIGMRPVDAGPLAAARDIERRPLQLFEEWRTAFWVSIALLVAAYAFVAVRDVWLAAGPGQEPRWGDLLLLKFNVVIAWHALALLTLTFGAGVVAALRQLATGTMKRAFPHWLDAWLRARKALGLLGVGSAALHAVAALLTNSLFIDWPYIVSPEGTEFQGSMLAAILAGGVYAALALTSLPSVAASLSWREWDFMQSKLGHVGLALASIHVLLMSFALGDLPAVALWADRHWLPPVSVLAVAPALLVLVLRLLIVLPPLSGRLARIRGIAPPAATATTRPQRKKRGGAGQSEGVAGSGAVHHQQQHFASAAIRIN